MPTSIITKHTSSAGAKPTTSDVHVGELAVNLADRTIYTKDSSNAIWSLSLSIISIGWSNNFTPLSDSIVSNEFHANANITAHELLKLWEESFVFVLSIEKSSSSW